MKLPRWLVVTLLSASVLAVLGYGAWWWVTWPGRTACEFIALVRTGSLDNASLMMTPLKSPVFQPDYEVGDAQPWEVKAQRRTLSELVSGRQRFILIGSYLVADETGQLKSDRYESGTRLPTIEAADLMKSDRVKFSGVMDVAAKGPHKLAFVVERGLIRPENTATTFIHWSADGELRIMFATGEVRTNYVMSPKEAYLNRRK